MILSFFIALFASLIGSLSGGGLSLVLFPLLLMTTAGSYASLLTVSKVSATVMTFVSGKIHSKKRKLNMWLFWGITLPALVGTAYGTYLVQYQLDEWLFKKIMGAVLLLAVIYLFFSKKIGLQEKEDFHISKKLLLGTCIFSLILNVFGGMFGGTGIFLTLYLVAVARLSFIHAVAYTMLTYAIVNLLQMSYLLMTEYVDWKVTFGVILGTLLGSSIGTHLQYLKGNKLVKMCAITVMLIIGLKMLLAL